MPCLSKEIVSQVRDAYQSRSPLNITGGDTKTFLGNHTEGTRKLDVTGHSGIIEYDPAELVLVARAGTPMREIENLLESHQQMLGFEPPFTHRGSTLGGVVAAGLAGPRRAYAGAVRDFTLGAEFINGKGEVITSGGKVMKNVAGFDLFRPMAGAMGTLGVLLNVSLRVIPKPETEQTVLLEEDDELTALKRMNDLVLKTQALSASAWDGSQILIRLSGSPASVAHAFRLTGGEILEDVSFWHDLNNLELDFFQKKGRLWRISVAPMSRPIGEDPDLLLDWGGAQRWLRSEESAETIRSWAKQLGGHAECYSREPEVSTYHPPEEPNMSLQRRFKTALDPAGILNPGRMFAGL